MNIKNIYQRVIAGLLVASLMLSFASCKSKASNTQVNGLHIEADLPYSADTIAYAEETIFSLVVHSYHEATGMDKITEKVEKRLLGYARRICEITAKKPVSEVQYHAAIEMLSQKGEGVVQDLLAYYAGEQSEFESVRTLYLDLSSIFGADHVAEMLYEGCLLIYDVRYERLMEKYETAPGQPPWYLEEADALAAERAVFADGIGKESFSVLVRCVTAIAELLSVDSDSLSGAFSDAEILEAIRCLDLSKISVTEDGWSLLLSYANPQDKSSYIAKLCESFKGNGDVDQVAAVMNDVLSLAVFVMDHMTSADITSLREKRWSDFASSVFSRFEENAWSLFEKATSISLSNVQYSELARAEYGDAYSEYLASIRSVDLKDLRARVGADDFNQYLLDYLAGICPAFSYEVRYDQSNQN